MLQPNHCTPESKYALLHMFAAEAVLYIARFSYFLYHSVVSYEVGKSRPNSVDSCTL